MKSLISGLIIILIGLAPAAALAQQGGSPVENGDPASDVNDIALGFGPLDDEFCSAYPCNIDVEQADLAANLSGQDYLTFIDALRTVGHSGEGHCHLQVH